MIPDRNNYANNDVEILYRLYLMYLMYVHNYSVQSFDNSERMIVMLCAYKVSFRIYSIDGKSLPHVVVHRERVLHGAARGDRKSVV